MGEMKAGDQVRAKENLWPKVIVGKMENPPVQKGDIGIIEKVSPNRLQVGSLFPGPFAVLEVRFDQSRITLTIRSDCVEQI